LNVANERQRWNAPIQGTACDAFKAAVAAIHDRRGEIGEFKLTALIHDEVLLITPEDGADLVLDRVKEVMEEAVSRVINKDLPEDLAVPVEVDGKVGATWQEAKE